MSSPGPRSLGANLLARDVPFGAITFEPSSPPESVGFAVSATATPEPELGASAAEKLRRAVAALEAFEDQRKADARLSAEEGDTEVSAPKLELMAASRPDAPVGDDSPDAAGDEASFRPKEASDEELTVVRPNPLVAQERAAYRDSQVEVALPPADAAPRPAVEESAAPETAAAEATTATPAASPAATASKKAATTRRSTAAPRAKYLEPTAPPRADRRGTVDGSAGPTVAVVEPGDAAVTEPFELPRRRVSTVASGAPTIITRRAPAPPPPAGMSALWSLAATLVAVAGVVTGVVWFVQKNQAATATAATAGAVEARLQAARTATLATPLPSAVPVRAPKVSAPVPNAKAESVELEALPVLPSLQVDPARVRLEQAREATKRELAAQEAPEALAPKAAPAAAPVH